MLRTREERQGSIVWKTCMRSGMVRAKTEDVSGLDVASEFVSWRD